MLSKTYAAFWLCAAALFGGVSSIVVGVGIFPYNNVCDQSDGIGVCSPIARGQCCNHGDTNFLLSVEATICSGGGTGVQAKSRIGAAQNGNLCAITLNSRYGCAMTSIADTAQGGSYILTQEFDTGKRSEVIGEDEGTTSCEPVAPNYFMIGHQGLLYTAPLVNHTFTEIIQLTKAERILWAMNNAHSVEKRDTASASVNYCVQSNP
jgi:hypothetical protein